MATPDVGKQCIRLILAITAFVISWYYSVLLVSRVRPALYLHDIHVASLNQKLDLKTNSTTIIYFDLVIKNKNSLVSLYYQEPLTLTFSYFPQTEESTINPPEAAKATYHIQEFYQGNGKVKHVRDFVVARDLIPGADDANHRKVLEQTNGSWIGPVKVIDLKVDYNGKLKFKSIENKKTDLVAGVTVEIDTETGNIIQNKTIELKYASGSDYWGFLQYIMFLCLINLFNLIYSATIDALFRI